MPQQPTNDLDNLVEMAHREVERQTRRMPQEPNHSFVKTALGILLFGALVALLYIVWSSFAVPAPAKIAQDLEMVLDTAKHSIEQARMAQGKLPESLPNASLASIVQYERSQDSYKLTSVIMGVRVTLESNGKRTTETGLK